LGSALVIVADDRSHACFPIVLASAISPAYTVRTASWREPVATFLGKRLGPYEVISVIGAGGMGEVYRARDMKLGRDVAIKVVPEELARDAERMARFQREAKFLASLNQPNIASIYGLEDSNSTPALVMELVEGPTLADRIRSGPIPIDEALPIARQICDALEYAHERGIAHRDMKPANVKVKSEDAVKILDFGLAKAVQGDDTATNAANSPTLSQMGTQAGILLGTAAYMSPEQAKGKTVDRRTDIWAFGCVWYEMLTGKTAFGGETVTETLAAILKTEPNWSQLPAATPIRVRVLSQRCLQKDPKQRLRDIGDARIALDEALAGTPEPSSIAIAPIPAPSWRPALPWVVTIALGCRIIFCFRLFPGGAARSGRAGALPSPAAREVDFASHRRICTVPRWPPVGLRCRRLGRRGTPVGPRPGLAGSATSPWFRIDRSNPVFLVARQSVYRVRCRRKAQQDRYFW
jgi:hypothetical protein